MNDEKRRVVRLAVSLVILILIGMVNGWSIIAAAVGALMIGIWLTPIFKARWKRCIAWVLTLVLGTVAMNYASMELHRWLNENSFLELVGNVSFSTIESVRSSRALVATGLRELLNGNPDWLAAMGTNPGYLALALFVTAGLVWWSLRKTKEERQSESA